MVPQPEKYWPKLNKFLKVWRPCNSGTRELFYRQKPISLRTSRSHELVKLIPSLNGPGSVKCKPRQPKEEQDNKANGLSSFLVLFEFELRSQTRGSQVEDHSWTLLPSLKLFFVCGLIKKKVCLDQ